MQESSQTLVYRHYFFFHFLIIPSAEDKNCNTVSGPNNPYVDRTGRVQPNAGQYEGIEEAKRGVRSKKTECVFPFKSSQNKKYDHCTTDFEDHTTIHYNGKTKSG